METSTTPDYLTSETHRKQEQARRKARQAVALLEQASTLMKEAGRAYVRDFGPTLATSHADWSQVIYDAALAVRRRCL